MFADCVAVNVHNLSALIRQIILQKFTKIAFAYKANAGAVLLLGVDKPQFVGYTPYFGLLDVGKGKENVRQLSLRKLIEKIGLVLVGVLGFQQIMRFAVV